MERRNSLLTPMEKQCPNNEADAQVSANAGDNYDQIYINNDNVNGEGPSKYYKISENAKINYNTNQTKQFTVKAQKCYNSGQDNSNICPNNNGNSNVINNSNNNKMHSININDNNDMADNQNNHDNSTGTVYTKGNNKTTSNTINLATVEQNKAEPILDHNMLYEKESIYDDRVENTIGWFVNYYISQSSVENISHFS